MKEHNNCNNMKGKTISNSKYLILCFILVGCSSLSKPKKVGSVKTIDVIEGKFTIGGRGVEESITIKNNKFVHTEHRRMKKNISRVYYLSRNDINQLEKMLIDNGATKWAKAYDCRPRLAGGNGWKLKYKSKRMNIESWGANCYPKHYKKVSYYLLQTIIEGKPFRLPEGENK